MEHRYFGVVHAPGTEICADRGRRVACSKRGMPYVITEPCVSTCDTACVEVCPVDAIHGPRSIEELRAMSSVERESALPRLQLYIDPEACICCAACEPVCPVDAIFDEEDLPAAWRGYAELNARFFRR